MTSWWFLHEACICIIQRLHGLEKLLQNETDIKVRKNRPLTCCSYGHITQPQKTTTPLKDCREWQLENHIIFFVNDQLMETSKDMLIITLNMHFIHGSQNKSFYCKSLLSQTTKWSQHHQYFPTYSQVSMIQNQ